MHHLPPLIHDLGLILITAGLVSLIFKRLRQPVVLGYLIAGILVGPEVSFLPTIQDRAAIQTWADIGVIFLLFGLGLEFSFKKLLEVGKGASITGLTEILCMFGLGYVTAQALGWSFMDSVFLGGMLSISSTTIILRAVDELGLRQRGFVSLVYGVLVVEDLVAILLLVVLSTVAVTHTFEGMALITSTAKLIFFLALWFMGGIFFVPWFLERVRPLMNEETSLIVSLGLCLLLVILATHVGFSPALGAFMMGSILSETPDAPRIEEVFKSVKQLFAAVFFVSIGMLLEFDPLVEHLGALVLLTLLVIFGKSIGASLGALMGGYSIKSSVQTGMTLAQIGEFSFVIAALGQSLKVTSDFLYPLAIAISTLTSLTTPYRMAFSEPLAKWLQDRLPETLRARATEDVHHPPTSNLASHARGDLIRLFLNSIVVIAIALAAKAWLPPLLGETLGDTEILGLICAALAILLSLPSLWAIVHRPARLEAGVYRFQDVRSLTSQAVLALGARVMLSLLLLGFVVAQFISALVTFGLVLILAMLLGYLGAKNFSAVYHWFENRFVSRLNPKGQPNMATQPPIPALAPWDAHLSRVEVPADSPCVGKRLSDIGVRERFGVTIAMIERGRQNIHAPRRDDILCSHDRLIVIGTDEQLSRFAAWIQETSHTIERRASSQSYDLLSLTLTSAHAFVGRSIRDSGLREATDGLIVGLERQGQRFLNPDSLMELTTGDTLWIVGDVAKLKALGA